VVEEVPVSVLLKHTEVVPPEIVMEIGVRSWTESLIKECPVEYPSRIENELAVDQYAIKTSLPECTWLLEAGPRVSARYPAELGIVAQIWKWVESGNVAVMVPELTETVEAFASEQRADKSNTKESIFWMNERRSLSTGGTLK
jgi:hypothetical protein